MRSAVLHSLALSVIVLALFCPDAGRAETGTDDPARLRQQALQLYHDGHYGESARLQQQALDTLGKSITPSEDTVQAMSELVRSYTRAGEPAKALPLAQRVLELREGTVGLAHPDTAPALHDLAELYRSTGDFTKALPLADRALQIREKALGANHPETAASLHSLGELYRAMGDYDKALPVAQRALSIREQVLGVEHTDTAESLNDLGVLYFDMHDDTRALSLYQRALSIREKALGPDHPMTAESVNNLAALYWREKDFEQARALFERALRSKEKILGADHPSTATALNNLAEVYRAMGDSGKAIPLLQRAVAIWEKAFGDHPHTASALNNLAGFYWSAGDYKQARPLLERAEAMWEKTLGPEHPETARALNLLAAFSRSAGDYPRALAFYRRGLAAEDRTLATVFAVTSEEQKLQFLESTQGHYLAALSLINSQFRQDPDAVRFGLELVLRRKGIVLDAEARTQDVIVGHLAGDTLRSWQRLTKYRSDLAKLLLQIGASVDQDPEEYRHAIEKLEEAIAGEEQYLGAHSGIVAQELTQRQVTADMLARRLAPGAALLEFVVVRDWDDRRLVWMPTAHYLAFVLTPDAHITLVDLGDTGAIDTKIDAALAAINAPDFIKDVTAYTQKTDAALADLYRQILQPLPAAASASGRLIVSPDGGLHKVPFAALTTPDGRYLVEQRAVAYVTSGRDLLRDKAAVKPSTGMLLVANPAFDDRHALRAATFRSQPARRAPDYEKMEYPPLPGTAEEARLIPPLVSGSKKVLVGKEATESAVRSVKSPQVLHLATHGFFLKDRPEDDATPDPLGRGRHGLFRGGAAGPMGRAGLAFAGANYADEITDGDDGILTALEVSSMDLYGTDLAVLSACETALGEVRNGQGVYGLQRAFVLAGARNLVMSLWPVSDKITRDLMERFYRSYEAGEPAANALQKAEVATIDYLRTATRAGTQGRAFAPVILWAPFILQQTGDR